MISYNWQTELSPTRKIRDERSSSGSNLIPQPVSAAIHLGVIVTKFQRRPSISSKSVTENLHGFVKERKRICHSYCRSFKFQLLMYWTPCKSQFGPIQTWSLTEAEVLYSYKVPPTMIQRWHTIAVQAAIVDSTKIARANWRSTRECKWPKLKVHGSEPVDMNENEDVKNGFDAFHRRSCYI